MLYRLAFTCILSLAVTAPLASGALAQGFQMPGADQPVAPQGATPPAGGDGSIGSILENLLVEAQPHLEGLAGAMQGTLQELSPAFAQSLQPLPGYPYRSLSPQPSPFGIGVLSTMPLLDPRVITDDEGVQRIETGLDGAVRQVVDRALVLGATLHAG